ncbi:MAG: rRNA adenine N-6-methyltransferase family protein [Pseudomonadota bacterium]
MTITFSALKPTAVFLREWARNPLEVAAISPSSTGLACLITSEISALTGPVLEIGPGTGAFTKQLLAKKVPAENLTLLEKNPVFSQTLEREFPKVRVVRGDAAKTDLRALSSQRPYGAVVSGLGLLSMSPGTVARILRNVFRSLSEDGAFYQFTYGPRCPVPGRLRLALGLDAQTLGRVWWNCPPAAVYRITRAPVARLGEPVVFSVLAARSAQPSGA